MKALLPLIAMLVLDHPAVFGIVKEDPLLTWTWRFPLPQGLPLHALAYGSPGFVAVGSNGTIIRSRDGLRWTNVNSGVTSTLFGVTYETDRYVAAGDAGTILVSSDGLSWVKAATVTNKRFRAIAANPSWSFNGVPHRFAAVGDEGTCFESANGEYWVPIALGTTHDLNAITFTGSAFVIVGNGGTIRRLKGTVEVDWRDKVFEGFSAPFTAVASRGELLVITDDLAESSLDEVNSILYAPPDQGWRGFDLSSVNLWAPAWWFVLRGLAYGKQGFVAVGDAGRTLERNYPGLILHSGSEATNWVGLPWQSSENSLAAVVYGRGLYVAVGDHGSIVVSSNAIDFAEITPYHRSAISAMEFSETISIATAQHSLGFPFHGFTTLISTNRRDWQATTTNLPPVDDLKFGEGRFVGVSGLSILSTVDGSQWQTNYTGGNVMHGVTRMNGSFVAVGDGGTILQSTDGLQWRERTLNTTGAFYSVTAGKGLILAAGAVAAISPDGENWSISATDMPAKVNRVVYGNGLFVAGGHAGLRFAENSAILISADGSEWRVCYSGAASDEITGIAYCSGRFMAVSRFGAIFKSEDGLIWEPLEVDFGGWDWHYPNPGPVLFASSRSFFLGASNGVLLESGNLINAVQLVQGDLGTGGFAFSFQTQADVLHRVEISTNLVTWKDMPVVTGTGKVLNVKVEPPTDSTEMFVRVLSE